MKTITIRIEEQVGPIQLNKEASISYDWPKSQHVNPSEVTKDLLKELLKSE